MLWKLIRDGRLRKVNVLGRALIRREDIDRLLAFDRQRLSRLGYAW
jgi:hypothetical protein